MCRAVLLSLLIVLPNVTAQGQTSQDSTAVYALIARYEAALQTRDITLIRNDYAAKAVWLDGFGTTQEGADSVLAMVVRGFVDSAFAASVGTRVKHQITTFIRPDVAIYDRHEQLRFTARGVAGVRDVATNLVLSREGGRWLIQRQTDFGGSPLAALRRSFVETATAVVAGLFSGTQVDEPVKQFGCSPPRYPPELRAAKVNGSITLRYIMGVDGRIEAGSIQVTSSTNKAFEQPAIDAVLTCSASPAKIKGSPVRQIIEQVVRFTIS